jgi:hypothetical protein
MAKTPAGHAYLLAFPFEMLVADGPGPICPIEVDGKSMTVYWPFRNREEPTTAPRWIDLSRVPRRPHTEPPHIRAPIPRVTPQPRTGEIAADSLRIDLFGANAESEGDFVSDLAVRLFGLIRHRTGQWWLKRPNNEGEQLIRNGFAINHRGELADGVVAAIGVEPRRGSERTLAHSDYLSLCEELAKGLDIPLSWDLFYDALYFVMASQGGKDVRRAVLDAANACEVAVLTTASRVGEKRKLSARQVLRALDQSDLLYNLSRGLRTLTGRDFSAESPENYRLVHQLWRARGSVAHGRLPGVRLAARPLPSLDQFHDMLGGVEITLKWLDAL